MKNIFSIIPFMAGICFPVFLSGNLAAQNNPKTLAAAILADSRLDTIKARTLRLLTGFTAGTSYGEVWIRDFNTFINGSLLVLPPAQVKDVTATGDRNFLFSVINDKTILQRMEASMEYLLKERWSEKYGLIIGATTIDWGIINGFIPEAVTELKPMTDRVIAHNGFFEWYDVQTGSPKGSGDFRGEAGVLLDAITLLKKWAIIQH